MFPCKVCIFFLTRACALYILMTPLSPKYGCTAPGLPFHSIDLLRSGGVRQGPEYKGNMDFTKVLCKHFPAYHYKPSQTFLQLELNHRQTFETERIFDFSPKCHSFFTKTVKKRLNLDQNKSPMQNNKFV